MAPCIYIGLALGMAPGGRIHFRSLEFADANRPTLALNLIPVQALCFGDLDFIADHLGQLRLSKGDTAQPHTPMLNHGPAHASPATVDPDALACRIDVPRDEH